MSRARAKGTVGENFFLRRLRRLFYPLRDPTDDETSPIQRAPLKGVNDMGDFVGVPWLHEAKNTARPLFQQWAATCEAKAPGNWVLLWKGDMRTKNGAPLVLMPLEFYESLVRKACQ